MVGESLSLFSPSSSPGTGVEQLPTNAAWIRVSTGRQGNGGCPGSHLPLALQGQSLPTVLRSDMWVSSSLLASEITGLSVPPLLQPPALHGWLRGTQPVGKKGWARKIHVVQQSVLFLRHSGV